MLCRHHVKIGAAMRDDVRDYYDSFGEREWERLANAEDGALEFAVTQRAIAKYLPTGARVLDIGGGPGRYSLWLAERGHHVSLADFSPVLIALAREKVAASPVGALVDEIVEADARDLSRWDNETFDAVLALGPFYHLTDAADRDLAARELSRVLRSDGLAFVAVMPRYAFLRRTLAIPDERRHLASPAFVARVLVDGVFENDIPGRFTGGYGVHPTEVAPFFARHGFNALALLAAQSIIPDLQESLAALASNDPRAHYATLDTLIRVAGDPSILGLANHLLYVGRKA
jgi:ubiquinone/menaquinone biosynthesis C-methylase UbiE